MSLERSEWLAARLDYVYPRWRYPVPIVGGGDPGGGWTLREDEKSPAPAGDRNSLSTIAESQRLTPWNVVFLEKLVVAELFKNFSYFYETQFFCNIFKRAATVSLTEPDNAVDIFI
jgi:hypothetical protein